MGSTVCASLIYLLTITACFHFLLQYHEYKDSTTSIAVCGIDILLYIAAWGDGMCVAVVVMYGLVQLLQSHLETDAAWLHVLVVDNWFITL